MCITTLKLYQIIPITPRNGQMRQLYLFHVPEIICFQPQPPTLLIAPLSAMITFSRWQNDCRHPSIVLSEANENRAGRDNTFRRPSQNAEKFCEQNKKTEKKEKRKTYTRRIRLAEPCIWECVAMQHHHFLPFALQLTQFHLRYSPVLSHHFACLSTSSKRKNV